MCKFKSAIVLKRANGEDFDLLHHALTDSHEDLVRLHKLNDNREGNFARVEFYPPEVVDMDKPANYALHIDEERCPDWFSEDMQEKVSAKLRSVIKSMIISGDADILIGGAYILASGARIACVKNAHIKVMLGSSSVKQMWGSSSVNEMWGSSSVKQMWESSSVNEMWGSSSVKQMWGSSSVNEMRGSSSVKQMWGSSSVKQMWGSSSVNDERKKK